MKNIRNFYLKICHFLVVEFSVYLNRRVFVMGCILDSQGWVLHANYEDPDQTARMRRLI